MTFLNRKLAAGCRVSLAALLAAQLLGCAAHRPAAGQVVTVKGELTVGAECLMIISESGLKYSLTGNPDRFKIGDRVCIRGRVAEASICMAGEATLSIQAIGPETDCP
jgi:hypothetical protein